MYAAIACLPDHTGTIHNAGGGEEEPNQDGSPYACNVTPNIGNITPARLVIAAMKLSKPRHFSFISHHYQLNGTPGGQTAMCGGRSYILHDDIVPPPAKD